MNCLSRYLGISEVEEEREVAVEGGAASLSNIEEGSSETDRAADLVRCEVVRSCAIDYAIRRGFLIVGIVDSDEKWEIFMNMHTYRNECFSKCWLLLSM